MRKLFEILYLGFLASALFCFYVSILFLAGSNLRATSFEEYEIVSALITDVSNVTGIRVHGGPVYYQDVTVAYQIDDKIHTTTIDAEEVKATEECLSVGDNIPIYVNKKDPTDVSLDAIRVLENKSFGIFMLKIAMPLLLVSAVAWVVFKSLGGKKEKKELTDRRDDYEKTI